MINTDEDVKQVALILWLIWVATCDKKRIGASSWGDGIISYSLKFKIEGCRGGQVLVSLRSDGGCMLIHGINQFMVFSIGNIFSFVLCDNDEDVLFNIVRVGVGKPVLRK